MSFRKRNKSEILTGLTIACFGLWLIGTINVILGTIIFWFGILISYID